MAYDIIVVGAGSAGCVAAARLSASGDRRVLVLEAGPDYPEIGDLPADIADGSAPTLSHDWGFSAEPDGVRASMALPRGRLVGGCSATNGAFFVRGSAVDYDRWAAAGNVGWSFDELLPLFCAVEADGDFGDEPWHGNCGPIPVSRVQADDLARWPRAFLDAARAVGHPPVDDHNRPGAVGAGPVPRNVRAGIRMSTAITHLGPARRRANLEVRADATVDRILISGGRARGVRLLGGETIDTDGVVLAAGTYASPAILLRSGVGPVDQLEELDIEIAADLPGVGANLIDHPLVAVDLPASPGSRGPAFSVLLTMRSSLAGPADPPDLHLFPGGPFDDPAIPGGAVFAVVTALLAPRSRGSVRLRSADPSRSPRIDPAHLRHPDDVARMVEATREARRISRTPPLTDLALGPEIAPGNAIDDDPGLARSIGRRVASYHHPVGTCAMGPDRRSGAVVNDRGEVHGIERLWVADASIMPTIPSANTNLPTIVVAERVVGTIDSPRETSSGRTVPGHEVTPLGPPPGL